MCSTLCALWRKRYLFFGSSVLCKCHRVSLWKVIRVSVFMDTNHHCFHESAWLVFQQEVCSVWQACTKKKSNHQMTFTGSEKWAQLPSWTSRVNTFLHQWIFLSSMTLPGIISAHSEGLAQGAWHIIFTHGLAARVQTLTLQRILGCAEVVRPSLLLWSERSSWWETMLWHWDRNDATANEWLSSAPTKYESKPFPHPAVFHPNKEVLPWQPRN